MQLLFSQRKIETGLIYISMKANPKNQLPGNRSAPPAAKKNNIRWISFFVILATLIAAFLFYNRQVSSANQEVKQDIFREAPPAPAAQADLEAVVKKLTGRWQRTDGGYIIELKNPSPDGKVEAAYFNPNPIHVGRSGWQNSAGKIILTVELQDANYPGSLYTLEFIHQEDILRGSYFQAVEKVNYDVEFRRLN
jgi:hypothetical protein